jgi:hypothetical protein
MAQFNLNDYETVEERHARALALHPDMRCVTVNHTTPQDRASGVWVVEARVYLDAADQEADLPKATDWAFEVDGQGMANKTSALENASTSALGRALRWALGGSKGPSQTEMAKVATGVTPKPNRDWVKEAEALALVYNIDALRVLYADAQAAKAGNDVLLAIKEWANVAGKS